MNRNYRTPTNPNTIRRMGALEALVQDDQERAAREEYAEYRENCARDLTAIEVAGGGIPTFTEWLEEMNHA